MSSWWGHHRILGSRYAERSPLNPNRTARALLELPLMVCLMAVQVPVPEPSGSAVLSLGLSNFSTLQLFNSSTL